MSRHQAVRRRTRRIWMVANALVLVVLSGWILHVALDARSTRSALTPGELAVATALPTAATPSPPPARPTLTKAQVLAADGQRFGISYPAAPFRRSELAAITRNAGAPPTLVEYFVKWTEEFRPVAVAECYRRGALPIVSWEPWAGEQRGIDQPGYSLASIAAGTHDAYIARFATAVRDYRLPIVLRFAHEMNGAWYGWSERRSGNRQGDFVRAWRHVHDVFGRVGATNVVWVWSPNIVRPVPKVALSPLYPGDAYVDWVGLVGYATRETTADQVFGPTLEAIRRFTRLPVLITETGAQPGAGQAEWTADLFRWLRTRPDVVGFVWFEYNKAGATADWRFGRDARTRAAFRDGVARSRFLPPVRT